MIEGYDSGVILNIEIQGRTDEMKLHFCLISCMHAPLTHLFPFDSAAYLAK